MSCRSRRVSAVLVVAALAAGLVHDLAVRHGTCPQHGEAVHVAAASPSPAPPADAIAAAPNGAPDEANHHHCAAFANGRRPVRLEPALLVAAVAQLTLDAAPAARDIVVAREAIYRLAPKSSPPSA